MADIAPTKTDEKTMLDLIYDVQAQMAERRRDREAADNLNSARVRADWKLLGELAGELNRARLMVKDRYSNHRFALTFKAIPVPDSLAGYVAYLNGEEVGFMRSKENGHFYVWSNVGGKAKSWNAASVETMRSILAAVLAICVEPVNGADQEERE